MSLGALGQHRPHTMLCNRVRIAFSNFVPSRRIFTTIGILKLNLGRLWNYLGGARGLTARTELEFPMRLERVAVSE